jgi:hypothetical protein
MRGWATHPLPRISEEWTDVDYSRGDRVSCTIFSKPEVLPGESFLIQVFAHLPEQVRRVGRLAREADYEASRRSFSGLDILGIERGSRITFELSMHGVRLDDQIAGLVWRGTPDSVQFIATIPPDFSASSVIGKLTIALGRVPIGHIKFKLRVKRGARVDITRPRDLEPIGEDAGSYATAFLSYASEDRPAVLQGAQVLNAVRIQYFIDILHIDPGERWERKLYRKIDESALFLLFWSRSAKRSTWVMKEVDYALARKGEDEFAPPEMRAVILEGPKVPKPPPQLAHLQFNDFLLNFPGVSRSPKPKSSRRREKS